jgi:hypothetical protein
MFVIGYMALYAKQRNAVNLDAYYPDMSYLDAYFFDARLFWRNDFEACTILTRIIVTLFADIVWEEKIVKKF